jgi:hypothetical protein
MIENISNNLDSWMKIDKNLKITVDETCLGKVSEGEVIKPKPVEKGKVLKTIKNREMFPGNIKWDTSSEEIEK